MEKQLTDYKKEEFAANKEDIFQLIGELACDIAFKQLKLAHPNEEVVEVDPDGDGKSTRYKEKFQDEFNRYYDEEEDRLATEIGFDFFAENGILQEEPTSIQSMKNEISTFAETSVTTQEILVFLQPASRLDSEKA